MISDVLSDALDRINELRVEHPATYQPYGEALDKVYLMMFAMRVALDVPAGPGPDSPMALDVAWLLRTIIRTDTREVRVAVRRVVEQAAAAREAKLPKGGDK